MCDMATPDSLCLVDELGRGTSTHDGQALAQAILRYLVLNKQLRKVIFSTHYQSITEDAVLLSKVQTCQMKYQMTESRLIYLYKMTPGVCCKSFADNVARIAHLPARVISCA